MSPILAPIINQLLETFILSGIVATQGVTNKINTHMAARYKSAENKASLTCWHENQEDSCMRQIDDEV
jgi:DUF1680 family protein